MGGQLGGEDDLQCFLHWCDSVLGLLIRVPHGVVSLRSHWKIVQQVSHGTLDCHITFISYNYFRLDYCGIAMLIMGSFVPWLYYGFYCHYQPKIIYLTVVIVLGFFSIVTSLWDKFSTPQLRPVRAGVFMAFGLSGVIPAIHYVYMEGWFNDISRASLGWLVLMGLLYILGAMFYALRIPERWFPGKFDLWVSHGRPADQSSDFMLISFRDNLIKYFTFWSLWRPSSTSTVSPKWQ